MPARRRGRPPNKPIEVNHGDGIDINSKDFAIARNELYNRIIPGALIIPPEQARALMNVAKLNDVQFEILYNEYVNKQLEVNEQIPERPPNYAAQSITNNGNSMRYEIQNYVQLRPTDQLLSLEQFNNVANRWKTNDFDTKTLDEWYEEYKELFYNNPGTTTNVNVTGNPQMIAFRSKNKQKALQNEDKTRPVTDNKVPIKFNLKENKAKYQLHKTALPNTFLIDIMYCDKLLYLIAINVNTRYLFAELLNNKVGRNGYANGNLRTTDSVLRALDKMIEKGMKVKYLFGDGEKAFSSVNKEEIQRKYGITFQSVPRIYMGIYPSFMVKQNLRRKTDPMHNSLGIIDRVIRTIRDMAYNIKADVITPEIMNELVDQYNRAPHRTLSELAGFSVSPTDVENDSDLESFIIRRIIQNNYNVKSQPGYQLDAGQKVNVFNEKDTLMKRRTIVQPGEYTVTGYDNGVYQIQGEGLVQNIPRYKLRPKKE